VLQATPSEEKRGGTATALLKGLEKEESSARRTLEARELTQSHDLRTLKGRFNGQN